MTYFYGSVSACIPNRNHERPLTIFRNAHDGHVNVGQNASRSSFVIVSDIVSLSAGKLDRPTESSLNYVRR